MFATALFTRNEMPTRRSTDKQNWALLDRVSYSVSSYDDKDIISGQPYFYCVQEIQIIDGKTYYGIKSDPSTSYNDPINMYKKNKINIKE